MGALLRTAALTVMGFIASYAMKKVMASVQKQADAAREQVNQTAGAAQDPRNAKELKTLKQDPATGVYYSED
jgi:type II secretory pathway pseudopilin PulG